jgi:hypothetical protein
VLLGLVVLAVPAGCMLLLARLGTELTLDDFETEEQALAFVSDHLPARLPPGSRVTALTYERWADWHLDATVRLRSAAAVEQYLGAAREARKPDGGYCGASGGHGDVEYFLPQWMACGSARAGAAPGELAVRCHTR